MAAIFKLILRPADAVELPLDLGDGGGGALNNPCIAMMCVLTLRPEALWEDDIGEGGGGPSLISELLRNLLCRAIILVLSLLRGLASGGGADDTFPHPSSAISSVSSSSPSESTTSIDEGGGGAYI